MVTFDDRYDITPQERADAKHHLLTACAQVKEAVHGLSAEQLAFKPSPRCWSISETLEHMAIIAQAVASRIMTGLDQAPAPAATADREEMDAKFRHIVRVRKTKVQAPERLWPTGRWTPDGSIEQLIAAHAVLVTALETKRDLRGHEIPHPLIGPLDGYQWILITPAHAERHLEQIGEVKADAGFPKA